MPPGIIESGVFDLDLARVLLPGALAVKEDDSYRGFPLMDEE
jgi:hypothetical protein